MQLHGDQVPDDKVWAVRSSFASDPSNIFLDWYITSEASTMGYREIVEYLKGKGRGGEVSRWLVKLPRQRMERDDAHDFIYHHVITMGAGSTSATRLDVFQDPPLKRR
jgi:hypothetical protein